MLLVSLYDPLTEDKLLLVMMTFDSPSVLLIPPSVALKPFKVVIEGLSSP